MKTVKIYLYNALAALNREAHELECALELARDSGYDAPWINALNSVLATNRDAVLALGNIATCINHPAEPPFGLKPGVIQPRRN